MKTANETRQEYCLKKYNKTKDERWRDLYLENVVAVKNEREEVEKQK